MKAREVSAGVTETPKRSSAADAGEFLIGGDLRIHRLGFGAMRITGKGIWQEPQDRNEAIRVLRRAIELEVNCLDERLGSFALVCFREARHGSTQGCSSSCVIVTMLPAEPRC